MMEPATPRRPDGRSVKKSGALPIPPPLTTTIRWCEPMTAAVDLFELEGTPERHEVALACQEIWLAAIRCYWTDCRAAMRGIKTADPEALDDLTSSRELLANLCEPLTIDPEMVAEAIVVALG